ncbi:hypothetical protein [Polynucleobacter sp. IMCC 29146]|nr:hypothetical protein [Polynucleobacter sp. IMCC 29146]MCE7530739.1 hypothetical protein [Polynucleobacter sp. IMCC 29146]
MPARIVEIAENQRHLSMFRGFMVVENTETQRKELGRMVIPPPLNLS